MLRMLLILPGLSEIRCRRIPSGALQLWSCPTQVGMELAPRVQQSRRRRGVS